MATTSMRVSQDNIAALKALDPTGKKSLNDILADQIITRTQKESEEYLALSGAAKAFYDVLIEKLPHEKVLEYTSHVKSDKTNLFILGKLANLEIQQGKNNE